MYFFNSIIYSELKFHVIILELNTKLIKFLTKFHKSTFFAVNIP